MTKTATLRDLIIVCFHDTIYPENYSLVLKPVGQYHRGYRKQEKLQKAWASIGIAKTIRLADHGDLFPYKQFQKSSAS